MPATDTPVQEQPKAPESLSDVISSAVEKMGRPAQQEASNAPETAPAATPEATPEAKPVKRTRKAATPPADTVLPPEEVDNTPPPVEEQQAVIEEQLSKPDKTDGIKALREAYAAEKQRRTDLENQLKQVPKAPDDYEDLKKKVTDYSAELERVALERHPEFRKRFGQQMEGLDNAAKKLVSSLTAQTTPEEFTALLAAPPSDSKTARINELIETASPLVASKVANLVSNYEQLHEQRSSMLAQHSETLKQLDMTQRAETQQRLEREKMGFKAVVGDLAGQLEYLKPVEGNAEWNNLVNGLVAKAENLYFNEKDPAALMRATVLASVAEPYRNAFLLMKAKHDELAGKLEAIEKAAPGFDGGKGGKNDKKEGDWDEKKSFADNLAAQVANAGGMSARAG